MGGGAGNNTALANIDMRQIYSGTLAVASVSGRTSFAALVVDNSGLGDLFTASASGGTRFTITRAGLIDSVGPASIGGTLTFKTNGGGQIQTSSNQALTIGGNTTGQVTISSSNGSQNLKLAGYTTAGCTLKTDSAGVVTCGTDLQSAGGLPYIEQSNGLTYVGNTTTAFAIGGNSTQSGRFGNCHILGRFNDGSSGKFIKL
jgi:hypothetical protein